MSGVRSGGVCRDAIGVVARGASLRTSCLVLRLSACFPSLSHLLLAAGGGSAAEAELRADPDAARSSPRLLHSAAAATRGDTPLLRTKQHSHHRDAGTGAWLPLAHAMT
jgi:hypothetical protein